MQNNVSRFSYKNPPIIEAIIDISVNLPGDIDIKVIEQIKSELEKQFPKSEEIHYFQGNITAGNPLQEAAFHSNHEIIGYKISSEDEKFVFQAKKTFTFSQLGGYENWDYFSNQAKKLWEIYATHLKPASIHRVGVRYINRIDIPCQDYKIEHYFTTYPHILGNNVSVSGFYMQAQLPQKEGGMAIINQALSVPTLPEHFSIVLDIDVFDMKSFASEEIWQRIELLREQKNHLFENSITEKTRGMFI